MDKTDFERLIVELQKLSKIMAQIEGHLQFEEMAKRGLGTLRLPVQPDREGV